MGTTSTDIWLFKQSEAKRGFETLPEFLQYLQTDLLGSTYRRRYRYTQHFDAGTLVLYYGDKIYAHLSVKERTAPGSDDGDYRGIYHVDAVVMYATPIEISEITPLLAGGRLNPRATKLTKAAFDRILQLGHPQPPISEPPPEKSESVKEKTDGEVAQKFAYFRQRLRDSKFRERLEQAYDQPNGPRCVITKCAVPDALEAAHIFPHCEHGSDYPRNGLLLRCDIHALFDSGLLAIDPATLKVAIADVLLKTRYGEYRGTEIDRPKSKRDCPDVAALKYRWSRFKGNQC